MAMAMAMAVARLVRVWCVCESIGIMNTFLVNFLFSHLFLLLVLLRIILYTNHFSTYTSASFT